MFEPVLPTVSTAPTSSAVGLYEYDALPYTVAHAWRQIDQLRIDRLLAVVTNVSPSPSLDAHILRLCVSTYILYFRLSQYLKK